MGIFCYLFVIIFIYTTYQYQYGVIIDGGSSGTRIFIYYWDDRKSHDNNIGVSIPLTQDDWSIRISPGFTTFLNDDVGLKKHINTCLEFAYNFFKGKNININTIPLYFYATAGARLLSYKDRSTIMGVLRKHFKTTGFLFDDLNCRIISGEEEGLFGWISANYLTNHLFDISNSYGIFELGGASLQIALHYPDDLLTNLYKFTLNYTSYQMYIQSFLKYGINEIVHSSYESLIKAQSSKEITHVCLFENYTTTYLYQGENYTITGTSDYKECVQLLGQLLKNDTYCHLSSCSIVGVYQPPINNNKFIAYAGFESIENVLNKSDIQISEIEQFAENICLENYTTVKDTYPNDKYNYQYCIYFTYVSQLFQYGFHLPSNKTITFKSIINNQTVSWTMGAMLYQSNILPWENIFDTKSYSLPIIILGITSGLLLLLLLYYGYNYYFSVKSPSSNVKYTKI